MRSSTSNSDLNPPNTSLARVAVLTGCIVTVFFVGWEIMWRSKGYTPTLNDGKGIFATQWQKVQTGDHDGVLFIGASRTRFDLDHDVFRDAFGSDPVLLGVNGAAAWPILIAVAEQTEFNGTVICGIVPSLFWDDSGGPEKKARDWVHFAENFSPSDRVDHFLSTKLEERLAFLQQEDLSIHALAAQLPPPPPRPGARGRAPFPPQLANVEPDGRERMVPRLARDKKLQDRVLEIWMAWIDHAMTPGNQRRTAIHESIRDAVNTIRSRGGEVVFLRLPSDGEYRLREAEIWPRYKFWDALLDECRAEGIHFEDHPTLSGFNCPDGSHLSDEDAQVFTAELVRTLSDSGLLKHADSNTPPEFER